ncbi:hypothetical protein B0H19DRAFT_1262338 [Mycena capillaripes]|nr:hypothetical protein B0H19DRAFT_1262338 [Mycena capillaripes]
MGHLGARAEVVIGFVLACVLGFHPSLPLPSVSKNIDAASNSPNSITARLPHRRRRDEQAKRGTRRSQQALADEAAVARALRGQRARRAMLLPGIGGYCSSTSVYA